MLISWKYANSMHRDTRNKTKEHLLNNKIKDEKIQKFQNSGLQKKKFRDNVLIR